MEKIKIKQDFWSPGSPKKKYTKQQGGVVRNVVSVFSAFLLGYIVSNAIDISTMITWISSQWAQAQVSSEENTQPKADIVQKPEATKPKFEFYTLLAKDNHSPTQMHQYATVAAQKVEGAEEKPAVISSGPSDEANDLLSNAPSVEEELASHSHAADANVAHKNEATSMSISAGHIQGQRPSTAATAAHIPLSPQDERATTLTEKKAPVVPTNLATHETYMIQVAAVTRRVDAEHLKAALVAKGYSVMIISPENKASWFRVVVGPFHSRVDAAQIQDKIGRTEHIQGMIRKVDT